ncbi:MAG: LysR family transcriptional regulator [Rhizobiales bacterium]|nr:LysR family transcriptional regulator [Hyphomicrobiales bacterium]
MDRFSRLEIFLKVVETGSFTAAGKKLNMSGSGVSKQIQNLEDQLKVKLFYRTTRSVSLTEAGELYYKSGRNAVSNLKETEKELRDLQATPTGSLKVNMPLSFGISHLSAEVSKFAVQYPDINLDLSFSDSKVDVVAGGYDIVVRIGAAPDSIFKARKLTPCPIIVCASPEYLAKNGTPETPEDLKKHRIITYTGKENQNSWTFQNADREVSNVNFSSVMRSDNGDMNRNATVAGVGISILPLFVVLEQLKAGNLVWILQDYHSYPIWNIYALYPADRYLTKKARLFIDMLVELSTKISLNETCTAH